MTYEEFQEWKRDGIKLKNLLKVLRPFDKICLSGIDGEMHHYYDGTVADCIKDYSDKYWMEHYVILVDKRDEDNDSSIEYDLFIEIANW